MTYLHCPTSEEAVSIPLRSPERRAHMRSLQRDLREDISDPSCVPCTPHPHYRILGEVRGKEMQGRDTKEKQCMKAYIPNT